MIGRFLRLLNQLLLLLIVDHAHNAREHLCLTFDKRQE